MKALWAVALVVAGWTTPQVAVAFQEEIPLTRPAAEATGERFLELFALEPFHRGRANCTERVAANKRRCKLRWWPGRTSGDALISAFVSQRNRVRSASIRFHLRRAYEDCPSSLGLGPGPCDQRTHGQITFRLRSGTR